MTAVTQVGTPNATVYTTANGTNTPSISWSGTQPRTAGDILVLVVNASATTSVTLPAAPAGWSTAYNLGNTATTPHALTACFYAIAAGGDAAPSVSVTTSGTTRCGFQLFELAGGDSAHPVDTSGTYASGSGSATIASWSFATSGNIAAAGEYVIISYCREQATAAAATFATTDGSALFTTSGSEASSRDHDMVSYLAGPSAGSAFTASGTVTSAATSYAAGGAVAFQIGPAPYSGGPQGWSSPAGVRAVYVRTGNAMATPAPPAAVVPPVTPFYPVTQAVQARLPLILRGHKNVRRSKGAPVQNPGAGPVFRPAVQPARTRVPQPFSRGRVSSNPGGPVRNPSAGPVFAQKRTPVRAVLRWVWGEGGGEPYCLGGLCGRRGRAARWGTRMPGFPSTRRKARSAPGSRSLRLAPGGSSTNPRRRSPLRRARRCPHRAHGLQRGRPAAQSAVRAGFPSAGAYPRAHPASLPGPGVFRACRRRHGHPAGYAVLSCGPGAPRAGPCCPPRARSFHPGCSPHGESRPRSCFHPGGHPGTGTSGPAPAGPHRKQQGRPGPGTAGCRSFPAGSFPGEDPPGSPRPRAHRLGPRGASP